MKRLRAPEQSDSGASSPAAGASAGRVTPNSTPVAPAGGAEGVPGRTKASVNPQAPDTQTAITRYPSQPNAAQQEPEPQARCNGDSLQAGQQTQGDPTA